MPDGEARGQVHVLVAVLQQGEDRTQQAQALARDVVGRVGADVDVAEGEAAQGLQVLGLGARGQAGDGAHVEELLPRPSRRGHVGGERACVAARGVLLRRRT